MSKQINRLFAVIISLSLLVAVAVFPRAAAVADPQAASTTAATARNAAIVATTMAVLKETSELRQLPILRPVKSGAQSRIEIERMVARNLDEQTTPAEMHATDVQVKKLGLAPPDFQYRSFIIKLLTEQVAGYYDTKTREFYLADWIELEGQKPVMAHELTHALQDQHFDLRRFEKWPKGDSDAEMAVHALIEGDATLAMSLYMAKNPLVALAFTRSLSATTSSSAQFKLAPRALRESLVFPYEQGSEWATRLYRRGGWQMVSQAFTKLPKSTEQIMHSDKYFAAEAPQVVTVPDVRNLLGATWKKLDYDVNGEWSLYLTLDQFLNSPSESKRAAAGWGGDRYAVYEGTKPGEVLITQLTSWDTTEDAREFFEAYVKRTWRRYSAARATSSSPENLGSDDQLQSWQTGEGGVIVELRGNRVLIVEGIPDYVTTKKLMTTLWQ